MAALLAITAAVYAASLVIVRTSAFAASPDLLSFGVAADLTLVIPLACWVLVLRRSTMTIRSLLPVLAISVLGAKLVLPVEHRSFIAFVRYATVPLELALIGYGIWAARRAMSAAHVRHDAVGRDTAEALEHGFVLALGDRAAARVIAAEMATLYYALFARAETVWGKAAVFSQHGARSASTTWGLGLAVAVESVVMHLLFARTHPAIAWGLNALGAYTVLWLVGHYRATGIRLVVLAGDTLAIRAGLRLTARLPLAMVANVDEVSWRTMPPRTPGYINAAVPGHPNVVLTLRQPTTVTGSFGLRRTVTRIGLRLDDPSGFGAAVRQGAGTETEPRR
jgi:hypothetical protein